MALFRRWFSDSKAPPQGGFEVFLGGNYAGRNVLIFTEYVNATYFISFDKPLRNMHAQGEVNLAVVSQKHVSANGIGCWDRWAAAFKPDIVVMTRYGQPFGIDILKYFRRREIPVVYHMDDDLLDVPNSLGAEICQREGANHVVEARRHLLLHSDLIYASTAYLAALLQRRFPTQQVVHGIYAPYMGDDVQSAAIAERSHPVIGYMGSKGHQPDLDLVVPALERLLEDRSDLQFELFGTIRMPNRLARFADRVRHYPVQKTYLEFLRTLSRLGWSIGLAPLVDIPFNRCKAPTKFIEYTACGIPVMASDIPVYSEAISEGGGMLVCGDWHEAISTFLDQPDLRKLALERARTYCKSVFSVSVLERQLGQILMSACK